MGEWVRAWALCAEAVETEGWEVGTWAHAINIQHYDGCCKTLLGPTKHGECYLAHLVASVMGDHIDHNIPFSQALAPSVVAILALTWESNEYLWNNDTQIFILCT